MVNHELDEFGIKNSCDCCEHSNSIFSTHPAVTGVQTTEVNGIKNLFTSPLKSLGGRSLGNTICLVFAAWK